MRKKTGILTLIPTPLDEESALNPVAYEKLENALRFENAVIVVEDHKPCRRRWLNWGLDRSAIENFKCLNEHTYKEMTEELLLDLKSGKNVYLMSDGGLPAFCDPGTELVNLCHQSKVKVTSTPFANSFSLAMALSGFDHRHFEFFGFIPKKGSDRTDFLKKLLRINHTVIINDAPYRMKSLLEQLSELSVTNRSYFLAMDLNMSTEQLLRGNISHILSQILEFKREFVIVIFPTKLLNYQSLTNYV